MRKPPPPSRWGGREGERLESASAKTKPGSQGIREMSSKDEFDRPETAPVISPSSSFNSNSLDEDMAEDDGFSPPRLKTKKHSEEGIAMTRETLRDIRNRKNSVKEEDAGALQSPVSPTEEPKHPFE